MKLLITLLTSYNENILYESYKTIKNQINHNFDFKIYIIVNSQNINYYNDVCNIFSNEKIKIIQTESNGKPGMGHNSLINIFKNNDYFDYLLPIDGDDFLYPFSLHQLNKILIHKPDIVVGGNEDIISNFKEIYNPKNNILLNYKYFTNLEPNIYINKELILHKKATPFRLVLINHKIFNHIKEKLYCEECTVFDDYLLFLHVLNLYYTTNLKIYYINLKNIYIYYKAHISSVCYQNSSNNTDNIEILINKFELLKNLESQNIKLKLPSFYISNYTNEIINFNINDGNIDYNTDEFKNSKQFKLNKNHISNLSIVLYNSSVSFIEKQIKIINNLSLNQKKKLYLLLENYIVNDYYDLDLIKYFLITSNSLNYIAEDIIDKLLENCNINEILNNNINFYYKNNDNVYGYLLLKNKRKNIEDYYYYNLFCNNLNININENIKNEIIVDNNKDIIILLDAMDINYDLDSIYKKGLGGTQTCYINLTYGLSNKYNVILMNRNKESFIKKLDNIYTISYNNLDMLKVYIQNIKPNMIIYNFIEYGKVLKGIDNSCKLIMYEHITVFSHFDLKKNSDYENYYDNIIFVSKDQSEKYIKYCNVNKSKIIIKNNVLSPIFYFNDMKYPILKNKELSIIYCSNPQRGLENFIYIYPLLKEKYKNLKLKIYSSLETYNLSDNEDVLEIYSKLSKINGVEINKCISQIDLREEMKKSLLFIYPSFIEETFCNCCIEAGSQGCNIISTNIGAIKEVMNDYVDLVDVNVENMNHPYYDIVNNKFIDDFVEKSSNIINKYLNNDLELEEKLKNQILYIKKKYNPSNYCNNLLNIDY